ncbi:histidine phosphatase family protein [Nanoarchaeota archaeon]
MLDLYLIRHAECIANQNPHIIGGRTNHSPISDLGKLQIDNLGKRLRQQGISFNEVYASPAVRTLETAKGVCTHIDHPLDDIIIHNNLQELHQGDWEGKIRTEMFTPDVIAQMQTDPLNYHAPNGESQLQVEQRMRSWLDNEIMARYEQEMKDKDYRIAVFTHGVAIKCLIKSIMDSTPHMTWKIQLENTSMTRIRQGKWGWYMMGIGDAAHLEQLKPAGKYIEQTSFTF